MDKEKWINETLDSLDGIKKAEPNPYLFPKILSRLINKQGSRAIIPVKRLVYGFAGIIILIFINAAVLFYPSGGQQQIQNSEIEYVPSQINPYLKILTE